MDLVGKTLGARYEILKEIGEGGMATVYKARCKLLNRYVAVKVLKNEYSRDLEFVKRFRAEAQSAASLTHPNIVSVYDVGEENGNNYIVMELLEGDTLKDEIEKKGKLPSDVVLKYASQIASALEAAHNSKIVHRDIKPQNIVLTSNNIAKVTDFGIAKMSSKDTITSASSTMGSVHYFSPEHAKGCYTDEKSDIYSLGVVMYEMATGKLPFNADTPVTVALKQIQEDPVPPKDIEPSVSLALNDIILKAMAKKPSDRYQSASAMLDDIFAAINNPSHIFYKAEEKKSSGFTQVVPIIGVKPEDKPKLEDAEFGGRKGMRENTKEKKSKSKKNVMIVSICIIAAISLTGLGILAAKLIKTINSKKPVENVDVITVAPNLIGQVYEDIKAEYEKKGLALTVGKYVNDAEHEAGVIVYQSVKEGEKIVGGKIEVNISKGAETVTMIEVVGKDYKVAKYELESLGLKPVFKFEKNDKVEANLIIEQEVKKGEIVNKGKEINIKVSEGNGKVKVIVPGVIGDKYSDAKAELDKLKLVVNVNYDTDTSKADGVVLAQSIKQNSEVDEGTMIELTVNRLQKTTTVTIPISTLAAGKTGNIVVRVEATVEGVTNTVYNATVSEPYANTTVSINGFSDAKIKIYIDNTLVSEKTITF